MTSISIISPGAERDRALKLLHRWQKQIHLIDYFEQLATQEQTRFCQLPAEFIDKLQIGFYRDPAQAAFKALAEF